MGRKKASDEPSRYTKFRKARLERGKNSAVSIICNCGTILFYSYFHMGSGIRCPICGDKFFKTSQGLRHVVPAKPSGQTDSPNPVPIVEQPNTDAL